MSLASEFEEKPLDQLVREKVIELGRGDVISKIDIDNHPGPYPIYSSSAAGEGKFGEYGKYMFDEELISWSVDGGGSFFYRSKHRFSVTNVSGYMRILSDRLSYRFLYYVLALQHRNLTFDYTTKAHPSVIRKLYSVPVLPRQDQLKIAEILETIDTAIKKTESLIAKYQQIKAGLMRDLFTRGVTTDGKLRPPREQAPELYKETPIGWIPEEWGCKTIEQLLAPVGNNLRSGPFGSALLKSELVEEGIPFLGIDNIYAEYFEDTFRRRVSRKKFLELNRYSVRPRDVVITIMGTVGRCCVLPDSIGDALSSKHLWTMTFDQSQVIPELVCWQLNYAPWVLSWFKRESQGAVMDAIQSSTLRSLELPVPPNIEQQEIFKKYSACHSMIKSEQNTLAKLELEKLGLMHDLLTSSARVPLNEIMKETS